MTDQNKAFFVWARWNENDVSVQDGLVLAFGWTFANAIEALNERAEERTGGRPATAEALREFVSGLDAQNDEDSHTLGLFGLLKRTVSEERAGLCGSGLVASEAVSE